MSEESSQNFQLQAHVNLAAVTSNLQVRIQRVRDLVAFGLHESYTAEHNPLEIPDAVIQVTMRATPLDSLESLKSAFNDWIILNGFRDSHEALTEFLREIQPIASLYKLVKGGGQITGAQFNETWNEHRSRFMSESLPKKISLLKEWYDFSIPEDSKLELLSINRARNCLTHTGGILTEKHKNTNQGLRITWREPQLSIRRENGQEEIIEKLPIDVKEGEKVFFNTAKRSREFKVGDPIIFSAKELSDMFFSYYLFGQDAIQALADFGESLGVPVKRPELHGSLIAEQELPEA